MSASPPSSLDDLVVWLHKQFDPDASADLHAVVLFDLTGPEGGSLVLRIEPGRVEAGLGAAPETDVCIRTAARDFFGVLAGTENVDALHLEGRLDVEGDLGLANRLRTLFPAR